MQNAAQKSYRRGNVYFVYSNRLIAVNWMKQGFFDGVELATGKAVTWGWCSGLEVIERANEDQLALIEAHIAEQDGQQSLAFDVPEQPVKIANVTFTYEGENLYSVRNANERLVGSLWLGDCDQLSYVGLDDCKEHYDHPVINAFLVSKQRHWHAMAA